jgi:hypothetical protein
MHRAGPRQATHDPFLSLQHVEDPAASSFLHVVLAVPRYQVHHFRECALRQVEADSFPRGVSSVPIIVTEQKRRNVCQQMLGRLDSR